ncbi:TVP38/TMEM64 family protein [Lacticaseibacillus zhaodongensis]|uniref:TVP38/TMEM64 family protein n=1 Tax=Lacticaseibacillus zhaodongensis TaxID=2668065 RepID=UPI0012D2F8D5|nr:VTT domain-containing protein [Lacticaseibacillus zhaodongensis]
MKKRQKYIVISTAALVALFMLGLIVWQYWPIIKPFLRSGWNRRAFINQFRGHGGRTIAPFIALLVVVTMIPGAPVSVFAILSGVCFGGPLGFVINVVGLTVGNNLAALLTARVEDLSRSHRESQLLQDLLHTRHPRVGLTIGYSVPFVPNVLVNLAAAKLKVDRQKLAVIIFIASFPSALFYAFGGDAILNVNLRRLLVLVLLVAASAVLIVFIHRDRAQKHV